MFEDLTKGDNGRDVFKDINDVPISQFSLTHTANITKLIKCAQKKSKDNAFELAIKEKLRDEL